MAIDPSLLKGYACMKADKISLSDDKIYTETNLVSKLYSVIKTDVTIKNQSSPKFSIILHFVCTFPAGSAY